MLKPRKLYLGREHSAPISAPAQMQGTLCAITEINMKTNFEISDNIALTLKNQYFDLHGDFDLEKIEEDKTDKIVKLYWRKIGKIAQDSFYIILTHSEVNHFEILNNQNDSIEGKSLSEVTYFSSLARENINSFTSRSNPNVDDDILYFFQNDKIIRINCEEIVLQAM